MAEPIIYHVDVNSAFLSWEAAHRLTEDPAALDLRTIPSVIGGSEKNRHGIVLAKSTPAKIYHIQTGEPLVNARKKCPELVVAPPNYALYVDCSRRLMELLREFAPVVEQYSIDEAFCDMTGTTRLYGAPVVFAEQLKDKIYSDLGFTVNIGVSSNRLLAKMASDFKKPNLVHTLFPKEVPDKMWPLAVEDLFFVGRSTSRKLHELGIHTIGDLAKCDVNTLRYHFKKHGEVIWNYANGRDVDTIQEHKPANKSYGNSITIAYDVTDAETAKTFLLSLCETVGARIRMDKAYISVVSVSVMDYNFQRQSHQTTLLTATNVTEVIYETACRLFDQTWNREPIRQIGVSTSHVTDEDCQQYDLFSSEKNEKLSKLNSAIDSIRTRYGEDAVVRARFINSEQAHMTGGLSKEKRTGVIGELPPEM
ncbi:MAG: DNA polymerase IV [Lachnospiraceae bacterium]|nr:DNA polymerase IV [Lachnospiraceae bacterium]